jgi:hypothetical protein
MLVAAYAMISTNCVRVWVPYTVVYMRIRYPNRNTKKPKKGKRQHPKKKYVQRIALGIGGRTYGIFSYNEEQI